MHPLILLIVLTYNGFPLSPWFWNIETFIAEIEYNCSRCTWWTVSIENDTKYLADKLRQKQNKHFTSVQFSCSVMSNSLRPHEPQQARPPCPSPTPGVHPNPCPLSQWWYPTISSSVVPFSSCPQKLAWLKESLQLSCQNAPGIALYWKQSHFEWKAINWLKKQIWSIKCVTT